MLKQVFHGNKLIAFIIQNDYMNDGIKFFTDNDSAQQIGYMRHPKNVVIKAHVHNVIKREISVTQEVLILKKGQMRLDLYSNDKEYIESVVMNSGDIVFLASGGHGIKCLDEVEVIEVKQGPYLGEADKVRFPGISDFEVKISE